MVKFFAWERPFEKKINAIRAEELKYERDPVM